MEINYNTDVLATTPTYREVRFFLLSLFFFRCCDAAHGCGVLKPTWLSGAQFIEEKNGTYKWNQPGLQANYYTERVKDRVMLQINQVPNDIQDFDASTFKKSIDNIDSVFALPSYCKAGTKCSLFSTCRAVGK